MAEGNASLVKEEYRYFCAPCKKEFSFTQTSFFISISSEESGFTCIKCGKAFTSGFKTKKTDFFDFLPYCCGDCGIIFLTPNEHLAHSFEHTGEWPFRCFSCQRGFATNSYLESHLIIKNVQCIKCLEIFWGHFCSKCPPEVLREIDELLCKKCSHGSRDIKYLT
ncbi:hypothetical protein TNIN_411891 [Trichonephila inaurata madagascariensis]|uniref:C2H2-type domain-containing protein n=1 Tax=Trichonephila inaurata madagascariensis TaxID=2747483 RepID=A0A8X6Y1C7_9ARAC|nr:hypothetical protein TNIN_411891 [Trichonephila inaurata madagascariensis]